MFGEKHSALIISYMNIIPSNVYFSQTNVGRKTRTHLNNNAIKRFRIQKLQALSLRLETLIGYSIYIKDIC